MNYQQLKNPFCYLVGCCIFTMPTLASAAVAAICNGSAADFDYQYRANLFSANGDQISLVVDDELADTDHCVAIELPMGGDAILWAAPLSAAQATSLSSSVSLLGDFASENTSVSEIIVNVAPVKSSPKLQLGAELLSVLSALTFGAEERASWQAGNALHCSSGESSAGLQLYSEQDWPENTDLRIQIKASGFGKFEVALSDQSRLKAESPLLIGEVGGEAIYQSLDLEIELPANESPWSAITFLCPQSAAQLQIESLVLNPLPKPSAEPVIRKRSAWVWSPEIWLERPEDIWSLQQLERINELFITIPVTASGEVQQSLALEKFVRESTALGISVWPVVGDPRDVLPESLDDLMNRVSAYSKYNASVLTDSQLTGIQFDIEPYLLPGFSLSNGHWRDRYVAMVYALHESLQEQLAIDFVVPFWFGTHENWGDKLLTQLALPGLSLTVMNYRTSPAQLEEAALPFLRWGLANNRPVRIAVEAGSLPDQTLRMYRPTLKLGELWKFDIGSVPVMVLFSEAQQDLPGDAFAFSSERIYSAGGVTFSGDLEQLNAATQVLYDKWASWPSFSGIAIHGLDEIYLSGANDE